MEFIKNFEIEKLKNWEHNPRKNDDAVEKLSKLIKEHGFINPVIVDENNIIRAGHTRVKAALKLGLKEIPVLKYNFKDEAHAIAYAIADNKSNEWAEWDFKQLKELISELDNFDFDLEMTGFSSEEMDNMLTYEKMFKDDEEYLKENYDKPEKTKKICPHCGKEI